MYCVVRHMVIFFSRLFCIMGAIYYIYRWMNYAAAGDQRELNTLRRETTASEEGTLMPCKYKITSGVRWCGGGLIPNELLVTTNATCI